MLGGCGRLDESLSLTPTQLHQLTRMNPARLHARILGRDARKNGREDDFDDGFRRIGVNSLGCMGVPDGDGRIPGGGGGRIGGEYKLQEEDLGARTCGPGSV